MIQLIQTEHVRVARYGNGDVVIEPTNGSDAQRSIVLTAAEYEDVMELFSALMWRNWASVGRDYETGGRT